MIQLRTILTGLVMGIAEIIPGVSGGTIAFISGIYERLLNAIKAFGPEAIYAFKKDGFQGAWKAIDGVFLAQLLTGMGVGIVIGIVAISKMLETNPEILWGFFFGLILISCFVIGKQISKWSIVNILAMLVGTVVAFWITMTVPAEGSLQPVYVFFSAMLAVSALMLPGISGSFVLLLLGVYTLLIPKLKHFLSAPNIDDFIIISIFSAGMLVGLGIFSRVLSWLFSKYKEISLALLTGFMVGSLNKIWPWRNISKIVDKESGEALDISFLPDFGDMDKESYKILSEVNVLPSSYAGDPKTIWVIVAMVLGILTIFVIEKYNKTTDGE